MSFSPLRCTLKETARYHSPWLCDYECYEYPVDSPQPSQFLSQLCDSIMSSCLLQRHFSNRFLHCINYIVLCFTPATNICILQDVYFFSIVFSLTLLSDFKLLKRIIFIYIIFSFLSKSECRPPIKAVSQILSWETPEPNSFSKIWDKVVTIFFFYYFKNYILLSNYIRDPVYLKTVWSCYFMSLLP